MRFWLPALVLLLAAPALAQDEVELTEDGLPVQGTGALGRFTIEEAEGYALRVMDGEVIGRRLFRDEDDDVFYEYVIQRPDDSIFEVEINALNGELYQIEVERLGDKPVIPFQTLPVETLQEFAIAHMKEKTRKIFSVRVKRKVLTTYSRRVAYAFDLKQSSKSYRVFVEVRDGRILEMKEID